MNSQDFKRLVSRLTYLNETEKLSVLKTYEIAQPEVRNQMFDFFMKQKSELDQLYKKFNDQVSKIVSS
ncbi:MAG: hypothetical protein UX80_C0006G0069 [Candidatus Amesbacteria bacterium GW2011_GWA2_47_11b]|uniref:Uncharacterized protein n=2 Tax=Candidatus Amesiibacteriota TaxID=1752730 RepID=A0A0G1SIB5_9BACT|nr:MAG: hypothetical protein UX42_C0003G0063 [Microgenomates group bacterium GW2011_GWC1_46_20]KKU58099.1 MAG: hypothetical protein UX80_C0006G0069 [Candidatus Amesbacteria bacterium GW2011_GWA2_47_11b]KKU69146.1 MAG: hypothetical protein UX92_C0014G0037 [Candidatus Amesbacteria bacterium GW2011_GWA1_47_20]